MVYVISYQMYVFQVRCVLGTAPVMLGIDFTHSSRAPPVDKSSPELLLMNQRLLHHRQATCVCSGTSQWVCKATDGTYHLLLLVIEWP